MNKVELVTKISEKSGLTKKDSEKALTAFEETVTEELVNGGKIQLVGFGVFDVADRAAREGRNPKTGDPVSIPAKKSPRFKAGKGLKHVVNA